MMMLIPRMSADMITTSILLVHSLNHKNPGGHFSRQKPSYSMRGAVHE
jgi:hypothetical protein